MDEMEGILLNGATNKDWMVKILQLLHYVIHFYDGGFVQYKTERSFCIMFAQQYYGAFKIRIWKERFLIMITLHRPRA